MARQSPHDPSDVQPIFRALADPTRRQILEILSDRPQSVSDVASAFKMTRPAVAKHLKILEEGALICVTQKGRERINAINPKALTLAALWISQFDRFWDDKLSQLKNAVEEEMSDD